MHLDHRGAHFPNFWPVFVASIYNVTILQLARNQEKNEQITRKNQQINQKRGVTENAEQQHQKHRSALRALKN